VIQNSGKFGLFEVLFFSGKRKLFCHVMSPIHFVQSLASPGSKSNEISPLAGKKKHKKTENQGCLFDFEPNPL
jgi:hypothetical protein